MTAADTPDILDRHGIRPTPVRVLIYRTLARAQSPMSGLELETALDTVDRSSITRSLALFQKQGIVRTIDDGSGAARFELANDSGMSHPHFHCRQCRRTFCLDSADVTPPLLPPGYQAEAVNMTIRGLCPDCSHKARH